MAVLRHARRASWGLVALTLASAGLGAGACGKKEAAENTAVAPVSVSAQPARLDNIRDTLLTNGNVVPAPATDWTVYAPEAARIAEMPLPEGAPVKTGDVLVRFDIASMAADVANSQFELTQAANKVTSAKAEMEKMSSLYDRGYTSRNDFEAAKAAVVAAESALARAQTAQSAAAMLADRAIIKAKFDGVVARRWHNEGDFVAATGTDAVIRVIDPTRVQISVAVPAGQLGRIAVGQTAVVSTPGIDGGEPATVVTQPATIDASAATQEIRLSLTGKTTLTAGMLIQVEILLDHREAVVVVPTAAIVHAEDGTFVMIAGADNIAHRRDVRTGLGTKVLTEILSGVTAGDKVIVAGVKDVADGSPIVIDR